MKIKYSVLALLATVFLLASFSLCFAGDKQSAYAGPPLDPTLMAFKDQGVWYFLCEAPVHNYRIPPHYLTYGPPPVPYCPPPMYPAVPQPPVRKMK
jgi:hypothetical protein